MQPNISLHDVSAQRCVKPTARKISSEQSRFSDTYTSTVWGNDFGWGGEGHWTRTTTGLLLSYYVYHYVHDIWTQNNHVEHTVNPLNEADLLRKKRMQEGQGGKMEGNKGKGGGWGIPRNKCLVTILVNCFIDVACAGALHNNSLITCNITAHAPSVGDSS